MMTIAWPVLMRAGLQGLRLPPDTFWQLTPAELQLLLGAEKGNEPMVQAGLSALMAAYPDTT